MHAQAVLANLTDAEILRHAQVDFDPLTGTALEAELMRRFEQRMAANDVLAPLKSSIDDLGLDLTTSKDVTAVRDAVRFSADRDFNVAGVQQFLDTLSDFDIDDPAALRKQLDRIAKFDQVMQDLTEPLATLQTLATPE